MGSKPWMSQVFGCLQRSGSERVIWHMYDGSNFFILELVVHVMLARSTALTRWICTYCFHLPSL